MNSMEAWDEYRFENDAAEEASNIQFNNLEFFMCGQIPTIASESSLEIHQFKEEASEHDVGSIVSIISSASADSEFSTSIQDDELYNFEFADSVLFECVGCGVTDMHSDSSNPGCLPHSTPRSTANACGRATQNHSKGWVSKKRTVSEMTCPVPHASDGFSHHVFYENQDSSESATNSCTAANFQQVPLPSAPEQPQPLDPVASRPKRSANSSSSGGDRIPHSTRPRRQEDRCPSTWDFGGSAHAPSFPVDPAGPAHPAGSALATAPVAAPQALSHRAPSRRGSSPASGSRPPPNPERACTPSAASPCGRQDPAANPACPPPPPPVLLRECKFVSKLSGRHCAGTGGADGLRQACHKRGHLAVVCPAGHQWVWCEMCCNCPKPLGPDGGERRGCTHKGHWFERDAFDTGRRNHVRNAHGLT